jgi:predicted acetyltransferase
VENKEMQKKRGYVQLGSLEAPFGALIVVRSLEDIAKFRADMVRFKLQKRGVPLTPEVEAEVDKFETYILERMRKKWEAKGVPNQFVQLFSAQKKKDAERIVNQMTIRQQDFTHLLFNCGQIGFERVSKHPQHYPKHLLTTDDEQEAFHKNGVGLLQGLAKKFVNKVMNSVNERRCVSAHMLSTGSEWHCFYFSYEDAFGVEKDGNNHWKEGNHVHYISHLWGLDKAHVWSELDKRQSKIKSAHIRYESERESK